MDSETKNVKRSVRPRRLHQQEAWGHHLWTREEGRGSAWWKSVPLKVLLAQSCLTLWNPMDRSLPDSSVHGILQARILEWIAIPFFRGSS